MSDVRQSCAAAFMRAGRPGLYHLFAAALLIGLGFHAGYAQQARVYVANDDHTDYMWTSDEAGYRAAFLQMLDYYLQQADQTAANPSDFQGRFNTDGSLWVWTYQKNRTPDQFARLMDRLKDGHITMPLQTLVLCYGAMPAEAVLRSMYYPGRLERAYGLRFPLVSAMENQTLPYGLPSLWAGAGARYSWKGVCGCATHVGNLDNRGRELYRAVGPDGQSVLMKWHSLYSTQPNPSYGSGGYAEAYNIPSAVGFVSGDAAFRARYPVPTVVGLFGKGGDAYMTTTDEFITNAQSLSNPSRRVIVSNEVDFFQDLETTAPPGSIPSFSGGFGNEWDLYSATLAEVTASVKRSVEDLRTAEALATLVSTVDHTFMAPRASSADSAFQAMGLYYEHDWTADGPYSPGRADYERRMAATIGRYVATLKSDAAAALGAMIPHPANVTRFYVFNPLGWIRTDVADLPVSPTGAFHVIDVSSGHEVRSQRMTRGNTTWIRILADGVPSVGYRVYEIQQGPGGFTDSAAAVSASGTAFENDAYRITMNGRGALESLQDKRDGNRELVRAIAGQTVNDLGSGAGTPTVENIGPVSATMLVDAGGTPAHRCRATLYKTVDRIDLEDEITSNFGDAVTTYAFGFDLTGFVVRHEEVGAIATAAEISNGGSYADRNGRYDYFTMNHFVDLSEAGRGITLSNRDGSFFQLGTSQGGTIDKTTPQIKALAGGRVDAKLGIAGQGGDTYFLNRYAIQTHKVYDQAAAMRLALEHGNPLFAAPVTGGQAGFPAGSYSFLTMSNPRVLLWALKPAEEGIDQGIIARFWNLSTGTEQVALSFPDGTITRGEMTTHLETTTGQAAVDGNALTASLQPQQLQTYRLFRTGKPTALPAVHGSLPSRFILEQNYPNPFNGDTRIRFGVPAETHVRIRLFNVLGQEAGVVFDQDTAAGTYNVLLDAGQLGLSSGMYLCKMEAGGYSAVIKVVLIR